MFCSKCGQPVDDGVNFCPKCGNNLSQKTEITDRVVNEKKQEVTQVVMVMPTGTAPLVMGLLGMFGGFIPIVQYITGLLSLLAIFVGASQRKRLINAGLPSGKATAGMVLGLIAVIITVIVIAMTGMVINSVFKSIVGSPSPVKKVNNLSSFESSFTLNDLNGTWIGDGMGNEKKIYMYEFSGSDFTILQRIDTTIISDTSIDFETIYVNLYKGYFTAVKYQDTGNNTYQYSQVITHTWRNDSWEPISSPVEHWYIIGETNQKFRISDYSDFLSYYRSWENTYIKQ